MKSKIYLGSAALLAALVLLAPAASAHTWIHVDLAEETTNPCGRSVAYSEVVVLDGRHFGATAGVMGACVVTFVDYTDDSPEISVDN